MKRAVAAGLLFAGLAVLLGAATADNVSAEGKAWWAHVLYLADDSLEGRKAGTEGHHKAAQYVADQFRRAKLQPAGTNGYFQNVPLVMRQIDESNSQLEILHGGKAEYMELGKEAYVQPRGESGKTVEAEAVFVGQGLVIPELNINDLAGLDLKGKIAVVLRGAPKRVPGPLAAHSQSTAEFWKNLKAAGAIGMASIYNPLHSDIPWDRVSLSRLSPVIQAGVPELVETTGQAVSLVINPDAAGRILAGTSHTMQELLDADKGDKTMPKFPLKVKFRVKSSFSEKSTISENVAGIFPGSDPVLKNEYVVYSAHLDHLGIGQPVKSDPNDRIYNGAMDNASGVASMIEAAKALRGRQLKRSVLFVAVTGEEGGLIGSKFFANKPTVPHKQIVADLNTDMFLPIIPLKAITVLGLDESDLGKEFTQVAARFGLPSAPDPEPQKNRFIRSDQYSFIRTGVPSLAFKFHADLHTPENDVMNRWLTERYHAPSDDTKQPVNIEGAVQFDKVMTAFLIDVADRPTRPVWYEKSFFRRYAQ